MYGFFYFIVLIDPPEQALERGELHIIKCVRHLAQLWLLKIVPPSILQMFLFRDAIILIEIKFPPIISDNDVCDIN